MTRTPVRRALISVSDKTGIVPFARRLVAAGVHLVASDGTAKAIADAGIPVRSLSEEAAPELLDGLIKTLHAGIGAAILADRTDEGHLSAIRAAGGEPIDLVVVDLYPFDATRGGDLTALIDIGGVTLLRAAAKNRAWVGAVSSPSQYEDVLVEIENGGLTDGLRSTLATEAFYRTAAFDAEVLRWLQHEDAFPGSLVIPLRRFDVLRYGENPHQRAALYRVAGSTPWWAETDRRQGKALSFTNYLDAESAWALVHEFEAPAATVVKHTNPCGAARGHTTRSAFLEAWDGDPRAAYGGVVAVNRPLDVEAAHEVAGRFVDVLVVPELEAQAEVVLAQRRGLRVLVAPAPRTEERPFRAIAGGFLLQEADRVSHGDWKSVGRRAPTVEEEGDLEFAWTVAAHCASNSVVVAKGRATVGIGAGEQSRVGAAERALAKAEARAAGAVAASDGFLPFRDTVDRLAEAGVTALVSPGGSIRDEEVVEAADEHDLALLFTGRRHFRH